MSHGRCMPGQQLALPPSWRKGWGHLGKPVQPGVAAQGRACSQPSGGQWEMLPITPGKEHLLDNHGPHPEAEEALASPRLTSPRTAQVYWSKETHLQAGAGRSLGVIKISALESLVRGREVWAWLPAPKILAVLTLGKSLNFSALKEGMTLAP